MPKFNKPTTEVCLAHQFVLLRIILTYCRSYNWITDSLWCHKILMATKMVWWSLICLLWLQVRIQSCHAWFEFHARSKQVVVCKQLAINQRALLKCLHRFVSKISSWMGILTSSALSNNSMNKYIQLAHTECFDQYVKDSCAWYQTTLFCDLPRMDHAPGFPM